MADAPKLLGTDTLRQAYPKFNQAIDNANEALGTANTAKSTADTAKSTADTALANSESTQSQLNAVVIDGDSSPMIAQALADTPYTTLKQKHDAVDAQLAEKAKLDRVGKTIISRHRNLYSQFRKKTEINGLALGNSICFGSVTSSPTKTWQYLLGQQLKTAFGTTGDWQPRNNGVPGATIANIANYISFDMTYLNPSLKSVKSYAYDYPYWIIMSGRNEVAVNNSMPIEDYEYFYRLVVRMAKQHGIDVICVTEPPYQNLTTGEVYDGNYSWAPYPQYADVVRNIAETEGCTLVDVWQEFMYRKELDGENITQYMNDEIHPNDAGHQIIANMIEKAIKTIPVNGNYALPINENVEYKYVPQQIFSPYGGTYTVETVTPAQINSTRKEHTGSVNAIKVAAGNSVQFKVPNIAAKYIIVTVMTKISTGSLKVQSPYNVNLNDGKTSDFAMTSTYDVYERSIVLKPTSTDYPASRDVWLYATGGDIYISGVSVVEPIVVAEHTKINGTETGTWADTTINGLPYRTTSVDGNKIELEWYGTNIAFALARYNNYGIATITTDNEPAIVYDSYKSGGGAIDTFMMVGNAFPLPLGWHKTTIQLTGKNASSTAVQLAIGKVNVFTVQTLDDSIVAKAGANINVYLENKYNHIRASIPYTVSNKVLTASSSGVIETVLK